MSGYENGNWHNANGGGLAYRPPPTVDEALPYSPFTSIIPFSPDIIPFPSAEPPTPPSTLTPDQQNSAKKAIGILNDEIKGQTTAQHLSDTLRQLKDLLRHEKLPEYNFKPMPQLATPPPDSPVKDDNANTPSHEPKLSPFASMLLKDTGVAFTPSGVRAPEPPRPSATPVRQPAPPPARTPSQPHLATANGTAHAQNARVSYPSSALASAPSSTPVRPGPAVMIQPISGRREDYQRYDTIDAPESLSQKRKDDRQAESSAAALRPHEREIADRKIEELEALVESLNEAKEDLDSSTDFTTVSTPDGDFRVMKVRGMDKLSDNMSKIINLGRFSILPVELVMDVQSLLQPAITSTTKNDLFAHQDDTPEWSESIQAAKHALKASKMVLDTMIEGRDDYRMRREEIIDVVIDLIKFIKDACIIPIVQARRSGPAESLFAAASGQKKELQTILRLCGSVIGRFATLIGKCNLSDRALNTLEYLTLELLMEQNSESEKDSIFMIQKFEQFRQKAVDVLSQIFARHAEQRNSILNGILSNLEKLPDKKASARQFKSAREVPIMTISAVFMRFVQAVATNRETQSTSGTAIPEASEEEGSDYDPGTTAHKKKRRNNTPGQTAQALSANAVNIAVNISVSLVDRASNVSKTGDKPFRNLLDLFIEDFCNVLGSPEWPAADMLLQQLLARMQSKLRGPQAAKQSVVDKDMALATLARIGCGVIDFKTRLKKLKRESLDVSQSEVSSKLERLFDEAMNDDTKERVNDMDLLAFDGPYRMVIESLRDYLDLHSTQDDPHLQSISGYHITNWLASILKAFPDDDSDAHPLAARDVRERVDSMIMDSKWLTRTYKFQSVSDVQSKIAAGIITLQGQVCRYVSPMVTIMMTYIRDKTSSKLRSRGISSLEQLVHKDPRVIRESDVNGMVDILTDPSPMVRESVLNLVSTCLERDAALERYFLPSILALAADPSNGPKKKAIKLLKDIYNSPTSKDDQIRIIAKLLLATQDDEKTISDLSRGVLEDILLPTTKTSARKDESQLRLERSKRSQQIIDTVQFIHANPQHLEAFEKFFMHAFSAEAKASEANMIICKDLVADMIDAVISPESGSEARSQSRVMTALSIFAKVLPSLFTVDHIQLLKLYVKEMSAPEDLFVVRPTVIIFRYVFATLESLHQTFAEEVRASLMRHVSKLANWASHGAVLSRETLIDVAHCLWTLTPKAEQGPQKLCTTITSVLCQLRPLAACNKDEATKSRNKIISYLILLGTFGKVCSFDRYIDVFKERLAAQAQSFIARKQATTEQLAPLLSTTSPASLLLLDTVRPFTMQVWDMSIRVQALQSLGGICQESPSLFMRGEIEKVFKLVFINGDNAQLRRVTLAAFSDYFTFAERRSESGAEIAVGKGAATGTERLGTSFVANENDSATLHIAQRFLTNFVDTALKNNDDLAMLATNIITSISRQGLVHPKECGAALVVLGTSPNEHLAKLAFTEHKRIHEKQESYLEKEYMQSIRMAFKYQNEVFGDSHGMRAANYSPKLARLFEVLKSGKKATFKKFVDNICKQIDFNPVKVDTSGDLPEPVLFARFCLENLALLDFPHMEELAGCLNAVEAIVLKNTGPAVALSIETEMPKKYFAALQGPFSDTLHNQLGDAAGVEAPPQGFLSQPPTASQLAVPNIDDARLRQITVACMILQMVWETRTFIRRCYNLHKFQGRIPQKEFAKPTQRNNFVSGKELWERLMPIMGALDSRETMIKSCYDFAELLEIDREAQVGEDGEDAGLAAGYETPTEMDDADGAPIPTSGRGRKRKSNVSLGNTPKKPRGRPTGGKNKKRNSKTPDGDDDSD
ncbi:sister chromatid cohesion protein-like protein Mis4 [Paraphoma chrysanthemicola]|uniref:Sister chromatid cohesion protein n=1 Tax=Paraphoma chrysanthemicola TaxID=798071 RepID=A0A8K0W062_9PLEO|nr:sister chromatid cohesion protein-like protein Mis4 [Paraphoma chrysanthemicola]